MATVLVTGGSGSIGAHTIIQLLNGGHTVRTTVRDLKREPEVRAMVKAGGAEPDHRLTVHAADLTGDAGWSDAASGCDYVLHIASPFPAGVPKHEDDLIVPAREGALRVLRAARDAGAKRVVLTSSFAAIGYGNKHKSNYDATDWTDVNGAGVSAYAKSKTIAERAAWDFVAREGGALELSVVNPVGMFGPVLGPDYSTSILLVKRFMEGAVPGIPKLYFGAVDVRDVADLHIRAMDNPAATGERFLAISGDFLRMAEIAAILRNGLGAAGAMVPKRELPNWMVRLAGLRNPEIRLLSGELGKRKNATGAKAQRLLGWSPIPAAKSILATAESLIRLGV